MILLSDILRNGFNQTHRSDEFVSDERVIIRGDEMPRFRMVARKIVHKKAHLVRIEEILVSKDRLFYRLRFDGWVDSPVHLYHIIRMVDGKKIPT